MSLIIGLIILMFLLWILDGYLKDQEETIEETIINNNLYVNNVYPYDRDDDVRVMKKVK